MTKFFTKGFFRYALGFLVILGVSFGIILFFGVYGDDIESRHFSCAAGENCE